MYPMVEDRIIAKSKEEPRHGEVRRSHNYRFLPDNFCFEVIAPAPVID